MGVSDAGPFGGETTQDPWRARLHDIPGAVLGAGILVTRRHVLTCAHVIPDGVASARDWPLRVALLGTPRGAPVRARLADGGWVPAPAFDDSEAVGDLALLELDQAVQVTPAPLRRQLPLPDRRVRVCGYPNLRGAGVWVNAVVAGPSGSWTQLDLDRPGGVEPGFSGAGVFDPETGVVIGMIVARPSGDEPNPMCWMVPISAVVGRLPYLGSVVTGAKSADDTFLTYRETVLDDRLTAPMDRLVGALASAGDGRLVLAFSSNDERRAAAFGVLVTTADREIRPGLRADLLTGPRRALPKAGSVDIAIDTTGRTTEDVSDRLAVYVGIRADNPRDLVRRLGAAARSLTIVVDSVDEAATPESLFTDLLVPLAAAGARVLAGARSPDLTPSVAAQVISVDLDAPDGPDTADPAALSYLPGPARLDRLDGLVESVAAAAAVVRARRADVARRIAGTRALTDHIMALRVRVTDLRRRVESRPPDRCDGPDVHDAITNAERRTHEVRDHVAQFRAYLNGLLARRDELRGQLEAYHVLVTTRGLGEDIALAKAFDAAHGLLWHAPCDLDAAARAVAVYVRAADENRGTAR